MIDYIDSHCHLYVNSFSADRDAVVKRAIDAGVRQMLLPAIDGETHEAMLELESGFPANCLAMMGVHPCSITADPGPELDIAWQYLQQRPFIAIGEIGLDFHWDLTHVEQQYLAFRRQIEWALDLNRPIVIHSRKSTAACIEVVKEYIPRGLRGVFHCFSGTAAEAQAIVDLGFYLGIGGVITYKNSGLDEAVRDIEPEWLLLETDSPYLTPVPHRGKRNESSYIPIIASKLAEVKGITVEELAAITRASTQKLFGL
jgi:TatD DNase family protein